MNTKQCGSRKVKADLKELEIKRELKQWGLKPISLSKVKITFKKNAVESFILLGKFSFSWLLATYKQHFKNSKLLIARRKPKTPFHIIIT